MTGPYLVRMKRGLSVRNSSFSPISTLLQSVIMVIIVTKVIKTLKSDR
jgi:hypothetical protein